MVILYWVAWGFVALAVLLAVLLGTGIAAVICWVKKKKVPAIITTVVAGCCLTLVIIILVLFKMMQLF